MVRADYPKGKELSLMTARVMKAAVLRRPQEPLSVEEVTFGALLRGQVLVRMLFSGICRSQLMEQQGHRGEDRWIPHLLGHEGFGIVSEVGPEVKKCKPGDRVIVSWISGAGIESENPIYRDLDGQRINSGKVTTFSTFSIVSENRVFTPPHGFDDRTLPLFGCALLTGGGMALRFGRDNHRAKIAILGFGGVGSAAALVLAGMDHDNISIIEPVEKKQHLARKLGFQKVFPLLDGIQQKFDLVIESSGSIKGIEQGFMLLEDKGTLVFASHPPAGEKLRIDPYELIKGKRIFGTWGGGVNPDRDLSTIGELILNSGFDLDLLGGKTYGLDQINQALKDLEIGEPGRPILSLAEGPS